MSQIDEKTLTKIAKLARIRMTASELSDSAVQLSRIFDWIEQLQKVDTEGVEEMSGVGNRVMRMRTDEVTSGDEREAVLANAPQKAFDCFVVPKVIE